MDQQRPLTQQVMYQRTYVTVVASFDPRGFVQPQAVAWADERTYRIDQVTDFRPAGETEHPTSDCYTVMINGQERRLYFERIPASFKSRLGRWYVMTQNTSL